MVFKFQHIETETIRQKVLGTIHDFNMLDRGDKILVAVSGGPDSVMLLHLLQDLAPMFALTLGISHVNHGLRPVAADSEALAVERLAQKHNLPFHVYKVKLDNRSGSLEEKARQVRYTFFHETAAASGYTKIALGHQADDNAEAVLMNLMRGSGTRGLAGIPA